MKRRRLTRRGRALVSLAALAAALCALGAATAGEDLHLLRAQALRDMEGEYFIARTATVAELERPKAHEELYDLMRVGRNEDVLTLSLLKKRGGVWSAEHNMIVGTAEGLPAYAAALTVMGESGRYYFVCGLVTDDDIETVTVIFDYGDGPDYMPQTFFSDFDIFSAHGERFFAACFPKSGEGDVPYTVHLECADAGGNVIYDTWERGDHY